jgi:alpha-tubulin suppressor-like RCC1 family protein
LGHIFTFGDNANGQLGINDRNVQFSNSPLLVANLSKMDLQIDQVCCGGFHAAAKTSTGEVFIWGRNQEG